MSNLQSETDMRSARRSRRRTSPWWPLALAVLALAPTGCGKRPPPLPPGPSSPAPAPGAAETTPADATATALSPELEVTVEPEVIEPGDSALLTWKSTHADRVWIEPAVGDVDLEGRLRFYPDATVTYRIHAAGPGGEVTREVTVEVRRTGGPSADNVQEEDLSELPLEQAFQRAVQPVFFPFDSAELTAEAKETLERNLAWLQQPEHRHLRILLEGHADQRGSEEYNLALGDKRAQVVRDYLVSRGMDPNRLETISLGEERPRDPRPTEEAYAQNRRTEFVLLQAEQAAVGP
ncbi:MAG: hypothetical protein Kow00109_07150 [Acidobacteriota bacterium]